MKLPLIDDLEIKGKSVVLRGDIDGDNRLEILLPTINTLFEKEAKKIILIGHIGRPENKDESLSSKYLVEWFSEKLSKEIIFAEDIDNAKNANSQFVILENLRFWKEEKSNDEEFSKNLSSLGEVFVNEAFASSHRKHASIVGIPKYLPTAFGLRFIEEINNLSKIFNNPRKPVIIIIGGAKKDKIKYFEGLKNKVDKILVGGRLPEYIDEDFEDKKIIIARLLPDKEDITLHSVEKFEEMIAIAGTIVLAGPMGKFEEEGHSQGTKRVFRAVASSVALKIAGGGDTESALIKLELGNKFDWVSVGGGATLEFLATKTLPAIKVVE